MSIDDFAAFVDKLSDSCDLICLRDLPEAIHHRRSFSRPLAVITVDDGYADFYSVALPVLAERRVPATLFVTAGFVDQKCWLWWDALRYLLNMQPESCSRIEIPALNITCDLSSARERQSAWTQLANALVVLNDERAIVLKQLEQSSGHALPAIPPPEFAPITWKQLRECESHGIEIGAHTMTHAFLPTLDPLNLQCEITEAKKVIENNLGSTITTFAYPNGMENDWSPAVEEAVKLAGYRQATLAFPKRFIAHNHYQIGRWSAGKDDPRLKLIINGSSILKMYVKDYINAK